MIGILCEKKSAADNYATALGGYSGVFEGQQYVICHGAGHIYEFVEPADMVDKSLYDKYHTWSLDNMPWKHSDLSFKRKVSKDKANLRDIIKTTFAKCDEIAVATDVDPTGEGGLLGGEIIIGCSLTTKKITRVKHLSETPKDICNAFRAREVIDIHNWDEYMKAYFRARLDFETQQWTRIVTIIAGICLREGRVKTGIQLLIGNQQRAYDGYVKKITYQARFVDDKGNVFINKEEPTFENKNDVDLSKLRASKVKITGTLAKSKAPDALIDTGTLTALLDRQGFDGGLVMSTYQKMYDNNYVSYPRTADKFVSFEQFNELLPYIDTFADLVGVDKSLLTVRTPRPTHVKDGGAHGANRPGKRIPKSLAEIETQFGKCGLAIYKVLCYNYLAMHAPDYLYNAITAVVVDFEKFKCTINQCTDLGFKKIFTTDDEDVSNKEFGTDASPVVGEIVSPRPSAPTVSWLLSDKGVLAKLGIGTPATRVQTVIEMQKGDAKKPATIVKKGNKFMLTEAGEISYKAMQGTWLGDLNVSKDLFDKMELVGKGELNPEIILDELALHVQSDMQIILNNLGGKIVGNNSNLKRHLVFNGMEGDVWMKKHDYVFTDVEIDKMLKGEKIPVAQVITSSGKKLSNVLFYLGLDTYNNKNELGILMDFANNSNGDDKYHTVNFNGQQCRVYRTVAGHDFTDAEIEYMAGGHTVYCDSLFRKDGTKFTATLMLGPNDHYNGAIGIIFAPRN